jgi:hypothetical protein
MNYLAGPLTRAQIPLLNQLKNVQSSYPPVTLSSAQPAASAWGAPAQVGVSQTAVATSSFQAPVAATTTRPAVPSGVREYFLPNNLTLTQAFKAAGKPYPAQAVSQGLLYQPVLMAQASVRFLNRKYNLDTTIQRTVVVEAPDRRGLVRWDNYQTSSIDPHLLDKHPDPRASFTPIEAPLTDARIVSSMEKDYLDWAYRTTEAVVRSNETLKVYAGPDVSHSEFRSLCDEAARQGRDAEIKKTEDSINKKIETIQGRLTREERELANDRARHSHRKMEEMGSHAETLFSLIGGRKKSLSSSLTKRRMTDQAKAAVKESEESIADFKRQIEALEKEKAEAIRQVNDRWGGLASESQEIKVTPFKKDVLVEIFGVTWMPFHLVNIGETVEELPGYQTA